MVSPAAVTFMERNNREVRRSNLVPSHSVSQCGPLSASLAPPCICLSPGDPCVCPSVSVLIFVHSCVHAVYLPALSG